MLSVKSPTQKNGKLILSVSKRNDKVIQISKQAKVMLETHPELGIRSVSDLFCKWLIEKFDMLMEEEEVKEEEEESPSLLKRFLAKLPKEKIVIASTIPPMDKYAVHKIRGKSVSQAYKEGILSVNDITNIYSGAAQVYYDMTCDRRLAPILHLVNSKNDTKRKNRLQWLHDKMKKAFEPQKPVLLDYDFSKYDDLEEVVK